MEVSSSTDSALQLTMCLCVPMCGGLSMSVGIYGRQSGQIPMGLGFKGTHTTKKEENDCEALDMGVGN